MKMGGGWIVEVDIRKFLLITDFGESIRCPGNPGIVRLY
jgi:hypothetical protein